MFRKLCLCLMFVVVLSSCSSVEGTRNKSYTYRSLGRPVGIQSLAIIPIEDTSKYPFLNEMIERNIVENLRFKSPITKIVPSNEFSHYLYENDCLENFASWYNGYKVTKFFDAKKLTPLLENIDANYLLFVRSVNIDREKIRAIDTGYSGWVSDSNNVWRINLKFIGELVDVKAGRIVWQGVGFSEDVNSPKDKDYILVIKHEKMPEIKEVLPKMVSIAADGFTNEMLGIRKK